MVPPALRARLARQIRTVRLVPGQALVQVGDAVHLAGVVVEGMLREVFIDPDGEERTRTFCFPGDFLGSWSDVLAGRPSRVRVEALAESTVETVDVEALLQAGRDLPEAARFLREVAERLYVRKADRELELLTLNARDRYAAALARWPGIDRRVQLRHLASYLGMTPVHLSRLRRRERPGG